MNFLLKTLEATAEMILKAAKNLYEEVACLICFILNTLVGVINADACCHSVSRVVWPNNVSLALGNGGCKKTFLSKNLPTR